MLLRKSAFADVDQRGRRVRAGDFVALLNKETRYWFAGATANVENRASGRYELEEVIELRFLEQIAPSIFIPILRMSFTKVNDLGRFRTHRTIV